MASGSDTGCPSNVVPVDAGDVDQDALLEFDCLEVAPVRLDRLLLVGAVLRVVDEHARHAPQVLPA